MARVAKAPILFMSPVRSQIILDNIITDLSGGEGSKAKLSQAVAQRWISTCKMMLRFLERWDALERFYLEQEKEQFPLKGRKDEVCCSEDRSPAAANLRVVGAQKNSLPTQPTRQNSSVPVVGGGEGVLVCLQQPPRDNVFTG